jgi:hypothetical protein
MPQAAVESSPLPRKKRAWEPGACSHLTRRCNGQDLLFRFQKYRTFYDRYFTILRFRKYK